VVGIEKNIDVLCDMKLPLKLMGKIYVTIVRLTNIV